MNFQMLFFTCCGMFIDTMILFQYLSYFAIKENKILYINIVYLFYFILNCILGIFNVVFWVRIFLNIFVIVIMEYFLYDDIENYEIGREAIIFILFLGISEFAVIPFIFFITGYYDADIFNDLTKPYLWIISMGLSRMIALCSFKIYRQIQKRNHEKLDTREMLIIYLPLVVCFLIFLIIAKLVLSIDKLKKEDISLFLVLLVCTLICFEFMHIIFFEKYMNYRNKCQEVVMLKQKNNLQYEYYKEQIETYENMRIIYHDLKNHMLISEFSSSYQDRIKNKLKGFEKFDDTNSTILNILLWKKCNEAHDKGIEIKINVSQVNLDFMDDMDICSIVGNILDNAIEACSDIADNSIPEIMVNIKQIKKFIVFKIENDCIENTRVQLKDNVFRTTKLNKDVHGIGLSSIKRTVEKYDGNSEFSCLDDRFVTEILIPIPINQ